MIYRLLVSRAAARGLAALAPAERTRLAAVIDALGDEAGPRGHEVLDADRRLYRLRVGRHRLIYRLHGWNLEVLAVSSPRSA